VPDSTADGPLLAVEGLTVTYANAAKPAVSNASFTIGRARRTALVGESGSGKTTMALAVAGFLDVPGVQITADHAHFDCETLDFAGKHVLPRRREGLAMTFQDAMTSLDPTWTIGSQLTTVIRAAEHLTRGRAKQRSEDWLERVGLTDPRRVMGAHPHELSGGMRQRVMLAIALACRPTLLIADEPTSALDASLSRASMDLLAELTDAQGTSLLIVTHDLHLGLEFCDEVLVMYRGELVETGTPAHLASHAEHPYTRALLDCVPTLEDAETRRLPTLRDRTYGRGAAVFTALHDTSLDLGTTTSLGIVGESGSGKSTLAKVIVGLTPPSTGSVSVDARPMKNLLSGRADRRWLRSQVQFVAQDTTSAFNPRHRLVRSLTRPAVLLRGLDEAAAKREVRDVLAMLEVPDGLVDRYPSEVSGGQRQRLALARALVVRPQLLVCDEVVSALDVSVQGTVLNHLKDYCEEQECGLVFVSHGLPATAFLCRDLAVMSAGRIVETGPTVATLKNPQHEYTAELVAAYSTTATRNRTVTDLPQQATTRTVIR
jgi:peptide/nickel transport system ATP-binding protein